MPDIVVVVPVPEAVMPEGVLVIVHVPVEGNPDKGTLPVETTQLGCILVPTIGAVGVIGWELIVKLDEATEVHPEELVTLTVYVFAPMPEIVVVGPVPEAVIPAGVLVNVHVPVAGKSFKSTLPPMIEHDG